MSEIQEANIINDDRTMASYINGDPFEALTQIIHNSLDADASDIRISIKYTPLGIIEWIKVQDNGTGIKQPDRDNPMDPFLRRGYSEKKVGQKNKFNRNYHGKNGEGRFKSYALGHFVEWVSKRNNISCKIMGNSDYPQKFQYISDYDASVIKTISGTIFTAFTDGRDIKIPEHDKLKSKLERYFLTIIDDNKVSIFLDGEKLSAIEHIDEIDNAVLEDPHSDVSVKTVL